MEKSYIGIFIDSDVCKNISLCGVMEGNPGIGGTEYMYVSLAFLLDKNNFKVVVFSKEKLVGLAEGINNIKADTLEYSIELFNNKYGGIFIASPVLSLSSIQEIDSYKNIKIIFWQHIDNYNKTINSVISKSQNFSCIVCLTRKQLESYYAFYAKVVKKMTVIGHFALPMNAPQRCIDNYNVGWIGHTSKAKSFDVLLDIWPEIVKKIPTAHLSVFGSLNLYKKNINLDSTAIFNEYKIDMNTVTFYGSIPNSLLFEKLNTIKVGIVNPSGRGIKETFCLSALNFASCAIPAIGGDYEGLKNTLPNKCGYRVRNRKQLKKKIVKLLLDNKTNVLFGNNYYNFVKEEYTLCSFEQKWLALIDAINKNKLINNKINIFLIIWGKIKLFFKNVFILSKIIVRKILLL